jgi:predicted PurR-regulated permease PerM
MTRPIRPIEARATASGAWATRNNGKLFVMAAATILALYLCFLLASPFMPALVWAVAVAVVTHPVWRWLERHVKSQGPRAALAVGGVALAILAPVVFLIYFSAAQIADTIEQWQSPEYRARWDQILANNPRLGEAWNRLNKDFDLPAAVQQAARQIQSIVTMILSGLVYTAVQAMLMLFVLFYLYRDQELALAAIHQYSPLTRPETDHLLTRLNDTIHGTLYGSVVVALVQGALGGFMFWVLGVPGAVLWGVTMGILATVPYLGTFVIWAPTAALLALGGEWIKAAILVSWGVLAIGLVDNLLYPMLVGNRLRQHTVISFIAVIGGLALFGASGIVLGPIVVTLTFALLEIWRRRTQRLAEVERAPRKATSG